MTFFCIPGPDDEIVSKSLWIQMQPKFMEKLPEIDKISEKLG